MDTTTEMISTSATTESTKSTESTTIPSTDILMTTPNLITTTSKPLTILPSTSQSEMTSDATVGTTSITTEDNHFSTDVTLNSKFTGVTIMNDTSTSTQGM